MNINQSIRLHIGDAISGIASSMLAIFKDVDTAKDAVMKLNGKKLSDKLFYELTPYVNRKLWENLADEIESKVMYSKDNENLYKNMLSDMIDVVSMFN